MALKISYLSKYQNRIGWVVVLSLTCITLFVVALNFEVHSEVASAPDLFAKIKMVITVFLTSGTFCLPVGLEHPKARINHLVFILGSILIFYKLLSSIYDITSAGNVGFGLAIITGILILFTLIVVIKIRPIMKIYLRK